MSKEMKNGIIKYDFFPKFMGELPYTYYSPCSYGKTNRIEQEIRLRNLNCVDISVLRKAIDTGRFDVMIKILKDYKERLGDEAFEFGLKMVQIYLNEVNK